MHCRQRSLCKTKLEEQAANTQVMEMDGHGQSIHGHGQQKKQSMQSSDLYV